MQSTIFKAGAYVFIFILAILLLVLVVDAVSAYLNPEAYRFGVGLGDGPVDWARQSLTNYIISSTVGVVIIVAGLVISLKVVAPTTNVQTWRVLFIAYVGLTVLVVGYGFVRWYRAGVGH